MPGLATSSSSSVSGGQKKHLASYKYYSHENNAENGNEFGDL